MRKYSTSVPFPLNSEPVANIVAEGVQHTEVSATSEGLTTRGTSSQGLIRLILHLMRVQVVKITIITLTMTTASINLENSSKTITTIRVKLERRGSNPLVIGPIKSLRSLRL